MKTNLEKSVNAINELNKEIRNALKYFLPELKKFEGKKFRISGGYVHNFNNRGYESNNKTLRDYFESPYNSLRLNIDIHVKWDDCSVSYFKKCIFIGDLDGDVLQHIDSYDDVVKGYNLNKRLTVKSELAKINKMKKLKEQFSDAYNDIDILVKEKLHINRH